MQTGGYKLHLIGSYISSRAPVQNESHVLDDQLHFQLIKEIVKNVVLKILQYLNI